MSESEQEKKSEPQGKPPRDPNLGQKEADREKAEFEEAQEKDDKSDELEPMEHEEEE